MAEAPDTAARTRAAGKKEHTVRYYDYSLILAVVVLVSFGLMMIYSTSYASALRDYGDGAFYLKKQALIGGVAFIVMLAVSKIDYHFFLRLAPFVYLAGLAMIVLVNYTNVGVTLNNSKRWFYLFGISVQPSEIVKLGVILMMVWFLSRHTLRMRAFKQSRRYAFLSEKLKYRRPWFARLVMRAAFYLWPALLFLVPFYFVATNNLSAAIIIAGIIFSMLFVASKKTRPFILAILAVLAVLAVVVIFTDQLVDLGLVKNYRLERVRVWKDPSQYASSGGFQVLQGLYAIGSGGLFGKGLGNSVQKTLLPEAQNDMIFSIICEELGLFGALCLILLFLFLFYRLLVIAKNAPDRPGFYLATGILVHIALQVVLHIAVVTNTIPNTGISLPLISYGGSSLMLLMGELGLALSVSNSIQYTEYR